jgi:hypothetical protein
MLQRRDGITAPLRPNGTQPVPYGTQHGPASRLCAHDFERVWDLNKSSFTRGHVSLAYGLERGSLGPLGK